MHIVQIFSSTSEFRIILGSPSSKLTFIKLFWMIGFLMFFFDMTWFYICLLMVSMVSIVTIKIIGYDWDEQVYGFDLVLVLCNSLCNTPRVAPSCPCGMRGIAGCRTWKRCHAPSECQDLSAPSLPSFSVLGVLGVLVLSLALLAASLWRYLPRRRVTVRELGEEMLKAWEVTWIGSTGCTQHWHSGQPWITPLGCWIGGYHLSIIITIWGYTPGPHRQCFIFPGLTLLNMGHL